MVDVTVEIGAKIDKLIEGVNGAVGQFNRLNSTMDAITGTATKMAAAIGIGLSISGIESFVEKMADIGVAAERVHSQLGLAGSQISLLKGLAKASGTDFDSFVTSLERGALNIQRATKDAFDPTNAALKVFGLTAKELINLPADQYFFKLADAMGKFEASQNRTTAAIQLGGRGILQMLPMIDKGSMGMKQFAEEWKKASAGVDVAKFASTHTELILLERSLNSIGVRIFAVLQPAINEAIKMMTRWVQTIKDADLKSAMQAVIDFAVRAITAIAGAMVFLVEGVTTAYTALNNLKTTISNFDLSKEVDRMLGLGGKGSGKIDARINPPIIEGESTFRARMQALVDFVKKSGDDLKKAIEANFAKDKPAGDKLNAPAMYLSGKRDLEIQKIEIDTKKAGLDEQLAQIRNHLESQLNLERISANERVAINSVVTEEIFQKELALAKRKAELAEVDPLEYAKANAEVIKLQQKHNTEMQALHLQEVLAIQQKYMAVLSNIQSAWDGQLQGLLSKTVTWAQAFKNILSQLTIEFIKWAEKKVLVWVATEAAQTMATTAGAATRTTIDAGAAAAAAAAKKISMTGAVTANAGETFGGVFAFLSPLMGPAAAGPATAASASVEAVGLAGLANFAVGAWELPHDMVAQVHKGEMIVPAGPAEQMRNGGGGGATYVTINAIEPRGFAELMSNPAYASIVTGAVAKYQQVNPSSRGKF